MSLHPLIISCHPLLHRSEPERPPVRLRALEPEQLLLRGLHPSMRRRPRRVLEPGQGQGPGPGPGQVRARLAAPVRVRAWVPLYRSQPTLDRQ